MSGDSLRSTQAFLLAAGRGRRAGGPKAWRDLQGRPALERHVERLAGLVGTVTVSVQSSWLARCAPRRTQVRWLAVDPDRQPLASLQALLAQRASDDPGFVFHVDMPLFEPEVFAALADSRDDAEAWLPVFEGKRGHPVLLAPELYAPILELDPEKDRLDAFLRSRRVAEIPVRHPSVLGNFNLPSAGAE